MTDDHNAQHSDPDSDPQGELRGPVIVPFAGTVVKPGTVSPAALPTVGPEGPEAFRSARAARARVMAGMAAEAAPDSGARGARSFSAHPPESPGSDVLSDTIRRWARPTTVDELKSRGVQKIRSISMSRVGSLLEKAVNRALIERTLESDRDEALTLSATARHEFLRLSREAAGNGVAGAETAGGAAAENVGARPLRERATSTLDRLRRELEDRRRLLADREKQVSEGDLDQAEDARLADQLRELFAVHAGVDDRALEAEVLGLVAGELRTSRRRARLARLEEHQREIGVLERRITKLSALLGETEDALRRVREGKAPDPGVSSIYDEVQGLGRDDEHFEQKSELMRTLFEANLALRGDRYQR
ncbi:MAG: hypothetical protein AAGG01_01385 [Planctomycetota bacterium]